MGGIIVVTAGQNRLAVGRKNSRQHLTIPAAKCLLQRSGVSIPQFRCAVVTPGQNSLAVGGEGNTRYPVGVGKCLAQSTCGSIPEARGVVVAAAQDQAAIWREGDSPHGISSPDKSPYKLLDTNVPQFDLAFSITYQGELAVRRKCDSFNWLIGLYQLEWIVARSIPQAHCVIGTARQNHFAIER